MNSELIAEYRSDKETVWNLVTDISRADWRSDLSKIEASLDGTRFTEYTAKGFATEFIITKKEPYDFYAFDMENKNFKGSWTGEFFDMENGGTKIVFREDIDVKNPIMRVIAKLFMNVKGMQQTYAEDLRKALKE